MKIFSFFSCFLKQERKYYRSYINQGERDMTKRGQVTQKQIAAETGVTQGIVSAVLRNSPACDRISDETRRRILETARLLIQETLQSSPNIR